ncbi:unnamed protein product [Phytophthora fragariaefolia]|uniref:Unnamed protein product n=1 Tax=Phytophthora fragariaefolia TaxID=1490495 RepID=A0A9W6XUE0_9STRA|nr:unnamed protein product [Phytophthora fragariaefolia]
MWLWYMDVKPSLRPVRPSPIAPAARIGRYSSDESSDGEVGRGHSCGDEVELPKAGSKRGATFGPHALHPEGTKRGRIEQSLQRAKLEGTKCVAVLDAEPEERPGFFKLEPQVKRVEAILVRTLARMELMNIGVSLQDIDQLLPLF